jgi:hypothetical protein
MEAVAMFEPTRGIQSVLLLCFVASCGTTPMTYTAYPAGDDASDAALGTSDGAAGDSQAPTVCASPTTTMTPGETLDLQEPGAWASIPHGVARHPDGRVALLTRRKLDEKGVQLHIHILGPDGSLVRTIASSVSGTVGTNLPPAMAWLGDELTVLFSVEKELRALRLSAPLTTIPTKDAGADASGDAGGAPTIVQASATTLDDTDESFSYFGRTALLANNSTGLLYGARSAKKTVSVAQIQPGQSAGYAWPAVAVAKEETLKGLAMLPTAGAPMAIWWSWKAFECSGSCSVPIYGLSATSGATRVTLGTIDLVNKSSNEIIPLPVGERLFLVHDDTMQPNAAHLIIHELRDGPEGPVLSELGKVVESLESDYAYKMRGQRVFDILGVVELNGTPWLFYSLLPVFMLPCHDGSCAGDIDRGVIRAVALGDNVSEPVAIAEDAPLSRHLASVSSGVLAPHVLGTSIKAAYAGTEGRRIEGGSVELRTIGCAGGRAQP